MARITFLGGDETGNVAHCDWGRFRFTIGQPVECDDPHIVAKASGNRFFRVEEAEPAPSDPLAKARAAKAAKRAATHEDAGSGYDSGASGYELQGRAKKPGDAA